MKRESGERKLKIYFNREVVTGPWGGGNKILSGIVSKVAKEGHEIVFNLCENIDVMFCMDPRPNGKGVHYGHLAEYKRAFGAKIVQRVGDVGTHGKPDLTSLVRRTVKISDHVIFPSLYAKEMSLYTGEDYSIIYNRPDDIFRAKTHPDDKIGTPISIVTHHWSTNPKKGFDTYLSIADSLPENFKFTYIGRTPPGFRHNRIKIINPLSGQDLAEALSMHDIYVTASQEEAGANHVLEAMACGIPVLYMENGGSIPEYVAERGVEFNSVTNFMDKMNDILSSYSTYRSNCKKYTCRLEQTAKEICEVICKI